MTRTDPAPGQSPHERILVCVGPSPASASLVHNAHRLAVGLGASWIAVTVDAPDAYPMNAADRQRLLAHLRLADALGAETMRLTGHRVSHEVIRCARQHGVSLILIGKPTLHRWRDRFKPSLVHELVRDSGNIEVQFVAGDPASPTALAPLAERIPPSWGGYIASLGLVILTTVMAYWGRRLLTPPDLVMLYLLPIMAVAFRFGQGPSLAASALSVAAYDFFFVHPYFTFSVSDSQYILTFLIMFGVGIVVSGLMTRIRRQEHEARERERQTDALHRLSREVMTTLDDGEVARIIARHASHLFGGEAALYLKNKTGDLASVAAMPESFTLPVHAEAVVRWSADNAQAAGRGTVNLPDVDITALPIATSHVLGALALRITDLNFFDAAHNHLLEAFARQASLAIDRARLGEEARASAIRAKSEELRGVLLSMASHDLRTPLAGITGAGTALRDDGGTLDSIQRRELLETICAEAERMERLVTNLLDMVRLESGGCQLRKDWIPFEEMAGSAFSRLENRCRGRQVTARVDENVPMLHVDPVFFEQVLVNLLDNALKYTPAGSAIAWTVENLGDRVAIRIDDEGPGIPPGQEERIFEKFVRGETAGVPGSGLGLAICQGVVRAHGGTIQAGPRAEGGSTFRIVLPQPPLPELFEEGETRP